MDKNCGEYESDLRATEVANYGRESAGSAFSLDGISKRFISKRSIPKRSAASFLGAVSILIDFLTVSSRTN